MSLKHRWHDAGPYSRHGVMAPESLREAGMIEPVFEGCRLEADRRETDKRDPKASQAARTWAAIAVILQRRYRVRSRQNEVASLLNGDATARSLPSSGG